MASAVTQRPQEGPQESDTCRICRGEGSAEEPLFHPCKCSGSIMYVHQDCLMEWLSHSQKKHCELCKTSFTFTKLYHPDMPSALPTSIFIRKAAGHAISRVLYWGRGTLVAITWLFWLPWTMRFVWWGLFFLADMGWTQDVEFQDGGLMVTRYDNASSVNSYRSVTREHRLPGVVAVLGWFLSVTFYDDNSNGDQTGLSTSNMTASLARVRSRATLLSGVPFFKNPTIDRITTDVLEGLIITIALVAAIVLVLLIREWVVQQQPIINMGADEQGPNPAPQAAHVEDGETVGHHGDQTAAAERHNQADSNGEISTPASDDPAEIRAGVQVDKELASWTKIEELMATIADTPTNGSLKDFQRGDLHASAPELSGPEYEIKHRMGALLIRVHETHVALVQEFEEIEAHRKIESLQHSLAKVARLTDVLGFLSENERSALGPLLDSTRKRIENAMTISVDGISRNDANSSSAVVASENSNGTALDTAQTRPSMPTRDESFVATEIQRRLEETRPDDHAERARRSSNSDRSWEEVESPLVQAGEEQSSSWDTSSENTTAIVEQTNSVQADASDVTNEQIASQSRAGITESTSGRTTNTNDLSSGHSTQTKAWYARLSDWLWGDITPVTAENPRPADERIIGNLADEEPFMRIDLREHQDDEVEPRHHVPRLAEADQAIGRPALVPNEAELAEEAEDLEGVMELIGMQGPLTGLFTNAVFAAIFVSCTTTLSIWVPFLLGKFVLVWVAHPISLGEVIFKGASAAVNIALDLCIFGVAWSVQWVLNIPLNWINAWKGFSNDRFSAPFVGPLAAWTLQILDQSYGRMASEVTNTFRVGNASHLTLDSHAALTHIKLQTSSTLNETAAILLKTRQHLVDSNGITLRSLLSFVFSSAAHIQSWTGSVLRAVAELPKLILAGQLTISHAQHAPSTSADAPVWTALDRGLTIAIGYAALIALAALYYTRLAPLASSREGRKIENTVLEILQQTGGVAKVVLIISIEMLVFPLYCGLLLDIAMLPLFGSASIESRLKFTVSSPWTSAFVHWFIGTCYMFHFALFVAMCRKILRKGVLYFIRDPDDPTFHPVRDVLERSVISQLRKIMSSALIYGGLVIVCLGSILWLLAYGISGVLPIRWSADNNYLGFPVDLLLYTSLKPLLVRFLTPSDWLYKVYEWWFRRSARALCLSHYLFGEDNRDERSSADDKGHTGNAAMAGRWVRVPGNDQVRIGRGRKAWTDVDEQNHRLDGVHEPTDIEGVGPNDTNFTKVYIPPHFRVRITLFFASLWALTAGAGFLLTVLPLMAGRSLFALMLPQDLWANDIYAFTVGLMAMCAVAFTVVESQRAVRIPSLTFSNVRQVLASIWNDYAATTSLRTRMTLRCIYVYGMTAFVMPCLIALLGEFFLLAPLHTFMTNGSEAHSIQLLRSWTLGVQYVRIFISIIQWSQESKPARALRAVVADGYFNPDAGKATRYFFLPILAVSTLAIVLPMPVGALAAHFCCAVGDEAQRRVYSSLAYPLLLGGLVSAASLRWLVGLLHSWRMRIRDETYLIGERLHNYGESTSAPNTQIFRRAAA